MSDKNEDFLSFEKALRELNMSELSRRRAEITRKLERAEMDWLSASERLDRQAV